MSTPLQNLEAEFKQLDENFNGYGWDEGDYENFRSIVDRLIVLVPCCKAYFELYHRDMLSHFEDYGVDHDTVEGYMRVIEKVFAKIDTIVATNRMPPMYTFTSATEVDEEPAEPAEEPAQPAEEPAEEPAAELALNHNKRKIEVVEESDVVIVKVTKAKRVVIEILDD